MFNITESITPYNPAEGIMTGDFSPAGRSKNQQHKMRVLEAARLMGDVARGRADAYLLQQFMRPTTEYGVRALSEAYPLLMVRESPVGGMSVSNFQALTVDALNIALYGYWNATPILSLPMVKRVKLDDFRAVKRYQIDGATTPPEAVAPGASPKEKVLTDVAPITYAPQKYESFTRVVWEAMVNDFLGIFNDLAGRLVIGANRGWEMFLTGLYVDANGPNASLYTTAFKNQIITANGASSNNPPLDIAGLQDALKVFARQVDSDGYPIILSGQMYLWYGPAYVAVVENLINQITNMISVAGGTVNAQGFPSQFVQTNNWVVKNLQPIMNPFIRLVCTTATTQDTMWGITLAPGIQNRPAMEFGTLTGFDTPQLFHKAPNTMAAGGGLRPELGDFYTMSQEMKVLSVYGGKQVAGQTTVASTGRGV